MGDNQKLYGYPVIPKQIFRNMGTYGVDLVVDDETKQMLNRLLLRSADMYKPPVPLTMSDRQLEELLSLPTEQLFPQTTWPPEQGVHTRMKRVFIQKAQLRYAIDLVVVRQYHLRTILKTSEMGWSHISYMERFLKNHKLDFNMALSRAQIDRIRSLIPGYTLPSRFDTLEQDPIWQQDHP
jgi:hypothetical protein